MVTAGVSGELLVEYKTQGAERRLRRVTDEIERDSELKLKVADERIAELQLETFQLREKMADRRLTEGQQWSVAETLREFRGTPINVFFVSGDSEVHHLASDITSMLSRSDLAAWTVSYGCGHDSGIFDSGIIVEIFPQIDIREHTAALAPVNALRAEGLIVKGPVHSAPGTVFSYTVGDSDPHAEIKLIVSKKP